MGEKKSDDQFRIAKETFHHKSEPLMRNAHVMSSSQVVEKKKKSTGPTNGNSSHLWRHKGHCHETLWRRLKSLKIFVFVIC